MIKKLLFGATLATAALISTQVLADPAGHRHGQNTPCTGASCPAATAATGEQHGRHGMGHGGMHGAKHAARGERHEKRNHGNHGAQRGNAGEGCPMHGERKPT
jgi:hypothetical protein